MRQGRRSGGGEALVSGALAGCPLLPSRPFSLSDPLSLYHAPSLPPLLPPPPFLPLPLQCPPTPARPAPAGSRAPPARAATSRPAAPPTTRCRTASRAPTASRRRRRARTRAASASVSWANSGDFMGGWRPTVCNGGSGDTTGPLATQDAAARGSIDCPLSLSVSVCLLSLHALVTDSLNARMRPSAPKPHKTPPPLVPICTTGRGDLACALCARGYWSTGGSLSAPQRVCKQCPPGLTTSGTGSGSVADCISERAGQRKARGKGQEGFGRRRGAVYGMQPCEPG